MEFSKNIIITKIIDSKEEIENFFLNLFDNKNISFVLQETKKDNDLFFILRVFGKQKNNKELVSKKEKFLGVFSLLDFIKKLKTDTKKYKLLISENIIRKDLSFFLLLLKFEII